MDLQASYTVGNDPDMDTAWTTLEEESDRDDRLPVFKTQMHGVVHDSLVDGSTEFSLDFAM